jgi:hypothetical protein
MSDDNIRITLGVIETINDNPRLLSLLYDVNLLPEQVDTKIKWWILNLVVESYKVGRDAEEKPLKENE